MLRAITLEHISIYVRALVSKGRHFTKVIIDCMNPLYQIVVWNHSKAIQVQLLLLSVMSSEFLTNTVYNVTISKRNEKKPIRFGILSMTTANERYRIKQIKRFYPSDMP